MLTSDIQILHWVEQSEALHAEFSKQWGDDVMTHPEINTPEKQIKAWRVFKETKGWRRRETEL